MLKSKLKFTLWILLFATQSLYALTTLHVTLSSDNSPGGMGDVGDLRYNLNLMNQNLNNTPDDYAIVFDSAMTIQLNGILPVVNNSSNAVNITIGNTGTTPTVTIDGNSGAYSGFFLPMGNVTVQNINFQNLAAKGGNGGNGISGAGGGMGAGGAIYVPQFFLNGSNPSITLMNVSINNCSAIGGNGGNYFSLPSPSGNEGGGGGGGFSGNGGSITTVGITGGAGGGGFGGFGGDVTLSTSDLLGGGGGGGGGWGSLATIGTLTNLGNGGSDVNPGQDGNGLGLNFTAGVGAAGIAGGNNAGGGGGGAAGAGGIPAAGGGGGGSQGTNGLSGQGIIAPLMRRQSIIPSGGVGGDGAGGGGAGIVITNFSNQVGGQAGSGGYGGGGGGGAGTGAYDTGYTVQGGLGGTGGGGGGGGVDQSGTTPAGGGNSQGGGGGGGSGPSNGSSTVGGTDVGSLGGGTGGTGANSVGTGNGGGGGGGGSGLGGAIFIDSNLNLTIQALSGIPTIFNTANTTTQAGTHGTGGAGGTDGTDGTALGNSIFLRAGSSLTLMANDASDLLTLGSQVAFTDDTVFNAGGTSVFVKGNGTVVYNGTTDYQGTVSINNANLQLNGQITSAPVFVCRNTGFSSQKGKLSGTGTVTGNVFVNSGTISPETGGMITLGSLLLSANSTVHNEINSLGTSLVVVTGSATLAGTLEIALDPGATPGQYTLLASSGITGAFDSVTFPGTTTTPNYTISYEPAGAPTFVQFTLLATPPPPPSSIEIPATVNGTSILNPAVVCCGRPVILGPLPIPGSGATTYAVTGHTGNVSCQIGQTESQTYLKMQGKNGSCTIVGTKNGVSSKPLTVTAI